MSTPKRTRNKPKKVQKTFFNIPTWQEDEWQDMPEFTQEDLTPGKSIIVHFETKEDMDAFAELTDQKITMKTLSIWYPKAEIQRWDKIYKDIGKK